jgi:cytochrome c/WD40 domain-containing protein
MTSYRLCILCPIVVALLALFAFLLNPPATRAQTPDPKKPISFMDQVAPILKENCFACHDSKKRKGRFDMTTFEKLAKGGDRGEPFVAGKPEESNLYQFMAGKDEPSMPPKEAGGLLAKEKVAVVERWIKEGAKFDGPAPTAELPAELRKRWVPPTPFAQYPRPAIVRSLVFTPDSKKLVIGGHHELLVYDAATAKLEKRISTRAERANALVFLPDGKLIVAGGRPGQEGDVRIYNLDAPNPKQEGDVKLYNGVDPKAGCLVRELVQADDEILCLALDKDGKKLAAGGSQDRTVRVWDIAADFKLDQTIENHADWIFGVAFSPDGKHLLTCSRDKTAKVWDLATKESVLTFPDHQNSVYGVAIKPDGKVGVSCGEDNQLRFWNAGGDGKQGRGAFQGDHSRSLPSFQADRRHVQRRCDGPAVESGYRPESSHAERPHRLDLRARDQPRWQPRRGRRLQRRDPRLEGR